MRNVSISIFAKCKVKKRGEGRNVDTLFQVLYVDVEEVGFVIVFVQQDPKLLVHLQVDDHYVQVTNNHLVMPIFVLMYPLKYLFTNKNQIITFFSYSKFSISSSSGVLFIITLIKSKIKNFNCLLFYLLINCF